MDEELEQSYRVLDVEPGTPAERVRETYRELVKVWHPDRFAGDEKLQEKAQNKIKEINLAYETIQAHLSGKPPKRRRRAPERPGRSGESAAAPHRRAGPPSGPPHAQFEERPNPRAVRIGCAFFVAIVALLLVTLIVILLSDSRQAGESYADHIPPAVTDDSVQDTNAAGRSLTESNLNLVGEFPEHLDADRNLRLAEARARQRANAELSANVLGRRAEVMETNRARPNGIPVPDSSLDAPETKGMTAEEMFRRGYDFALGNGFEVDSAMAVKWYEHAAKAGHSEAAFYLAIMLLTGEKDVESDPVEALAWCLVSAARGNVRALRSQKVFERRLSSRQIERARTRAKELLGAP